MKKILIFVLSFICLKSFGQYPVNQSLGSDSTLVTSKGALKSRLINRPFSDTTQANTQRIKFYDGAQIWTTTDNKFWLRDSANNIWTQPGGSVTGANNGDTLIAGMVGLGGIMIRSTRISGSNFPLIWDSLGTGTRFKSLPNASAGTLRKIEIINSDGTDSARLYVSGKTGGATLREILLQTNATAFNSIASVFVNKISSGLVSAQVSSNSPTKIGNLYVDTTVVYLSKGDTAALRKSYFYLYDDSTIWWHSLTSQIKLSQGYQDSYARDSLVWRSQNRNTHISIYPDSMSLWQATGEYYVYNLERVTDSTGLDLMAWDRSNSEWVRIPSDIVGGAGGATPNLQTVFAVESNSPVMTANANEIKLNPAGSSGVVKTFSLGATSFADDSRIYIDNNGTGNGSFDVWAQDSANNNAVFVRSDVGGKRVYLSSQRAAASANNLNVYSDSTVFQFTAGTADYRFKGVADLFYTDTTLNKPAVFDAQGRLRRLSYWPSGGGGSSDITIGTTTITSGTNTRPLYNNAGVVGEYTITGTGTVVAMQTAPTFVTSITAPLVIGGTGTTDDLILQSTSGVAAAGSVVQIKTGNNGALTAYSLNELGSATIGSTAAATSTVPLIVTGPTSHATYIQQWTKNASNYWAAITQSGAIRFTNDGTEITGNDYAEIGYITGVGGPGFVNRSVDPDPVFLMGASATEALRMKSTYGLGWSSSTATAAASDAAIGRNGTRQLYIQGIGSSATNAVARPFILINATSGTAVAGMGTGMEWQYENGSGTQSPMMQIDAVSTDVTAASEDADFVVTTKDAGALTESFRIDSDGKPIFRSTVTAGGTTGAQTINKASGTVNFAAAATTLVVTNSLVTTSSIVFAVIRTNDNTATIKNVVPAAGSFTITLTAAATAETSVGFLVIN